MTKEEAMKIMNEWNKCEELVIRENTDYDKTIYMQRKEAIETVLNMLKEKDRQINSKNGAINALQCALKERTEERDKKGDIVAKQNKIIDLMAEHLIGMTFSDKENIEIIFDNKEDVKQYFKEIAERESEEC